MEGFRKQKLYRPNLNEVSEVLLSGLQTLFSVVIVSVIDCPNLKQKPYMLASEGLGGSPALADVGGDSYQVPLPNFDKVYNLKEIARKMDMPNALIIGAASGPVHQIGVNSELAANVKFGENAFNNSYVAKLSPENECQLIHLKNSTDFCLSGNLFLSEGLKDKVIQVIAMNRTAPGNFVTCMRKALADHYKDIPVGMGGVFVLKSGEANIHLAPNYYDRPLYTDEDMKNWLKFFNMSAPLSCLSRFVSSDPGLDLKLEHTHCFSDHGQGGHYEVDSEAVFVEYEGYFNVAEQIYRFDAPTHQVCRD